MILAQEVHAQKNLRARGLSFNGWQLLLGLLHAMQIRKLEISIRLRAIHMDDAFDNLAPKRHASARNVNANRTETVGRVEIVNVSGVAITGSVDVQNLVEQVNVAIAKRVLHSDTTLSTFKAYLSNGCDRRRSM